MTITETFAAISKLRVDAEQIERALHQHAAAEREPVAHAALFRLHGVLRDFCLAMPVAS